MKLKMTIAEALEFADEWSRGMTIYEGSQGWRVVCMLLAEEVRRLAALEKAIMDAEPVAWLVCSVNKDKSLSLEHAAPWKEAAHEHINDAINEYGVEDAASWVVREVYTLNGIKKP